MVRRAGKADACSLCASLGSCSALSVGTPLLRLRIAFLMVLPRDSRSGETLAEFATFSTHGRERVGAETVGPPESDARCSWTKLRAEVQWYN